ncbi:MAG: FliM/FliN family flagellar motor switch protein [Proteobacteria bacterium]|nr:FliM/FliN family flagellar motor switch protein [Pseudomonadota bacterium]
MKPERAFVAERPVAQHCAELLRRGPEPVDLLPDLARMGERLAKALGPALATLCGGEVPELAVKQPRDVSETDLIQTLGPIAANALFSTGVPGVNLLASAEGRAVLQIVDRAFGGTGQVPENLPASFPPSVELMVHRIENLIGGALAAALGLDAAAAPQVQRRANRFADLSPWPAGARIALLAIEVTGTQAASWLLTLALPLAMLPKLFGQGFSATPARSPANPAATPFAAVPLSLRSVLIDMKVPLTVVSALEVGAVLPVAVARAVPLDVAGEIVAHGTVGAQDDRVAIKLTHIA